MTLADRHSCPGVVDLTGTDIEQRMSMGHRDVGLVLGLTVRSNRLEDQQAFVLLKPNPGGAIALLGEEALDVTQPTPLPLDQASAFTRAKPTPPPTSTRRWKLMMESPP